MNEQKFHAEEMKRHSSIAKEVRARAELSRNHMRSELDRVSKVIDDASIKIPKGQ